MFQKAALVLLFGAVFSLDLAPAPDIFQVQQEDNVTRVCQASEMILSCSWFTRTCSVGFETNREIKKASKGTNTTILEKEESASTKVRLALLGGIFILTFYLFSSSPKLP